MGRELNPRIGNLDLKFVCELRPGLIGWMLIDWCLCATQLKETGSILPALALVTLFQTIYVLDALKYEVGTIKLYVIMNSKDVYISLRTYSLNQLPIVLPCQHTYNS